MSTAVSRSLERAAVEPVNILALSGGGQWGAFGAGFLKGWTHSGKRPPFRVVAGTSTGALIATYAFLGSTEDDALGKAYLDIKGDRDVFESHLPLWALLFKPSLATTEPLRKLLESHVTPLMVKAVGDEGRTGRRLLVGAVDLDHGGFVPLDLTKLAEAGPGAHSSYVDALMASTAIPVKFPPQYRQQVMFVDGGARRNIFVETLLREIESRGLARGESGSRPTIYSIVNRIRGVRPRCPKENIPSIAGRSIDVLFDETTEGNLLRVYLQAQRAGMDFKFVSIPPGACANQVAQSKEDQFDHAIMECLYEEGVTLGSKVGQKDDPWLTDPLVQ